MRDLYWYKLSSADVIYVEVVLCSQDYKSLCYNKKLVNERLSGNKNM